MTIAATCEKADIPKVRRYGGRYQTRLTESQAIRIAEAIHRDPWELGF